MVIQNFNGQPIEVIEGGALRGQNLFHSLLEFNVDTGRGAYFFVPTADIQNVITRVTGNTRSEINGVLGTFSIDAGNLVGSNADLFLINPNGIIIGPGARLDIGGSFVASTANAIEFGDQGIFSATNPEAPSLLTIQPSAFLFNQLGAGPIEVNSTNLRVPNGQTLGLLGGTVTIDNSRLDAWDGRIEIGAVGSLGSVVLHDNGSFRLVDGMERADVTFSNGSLADVTLDTGGDIGITAQNIFFSEASELRAGIEVNLGSLGSQAGNLTLDATGDIQVLEESLIANNVRTNSIGNGGEIYIRANSITVGSGSRISASALGQGNAGNLVINVNDRIDINGTSADGQLFSGIGSIVGIGALGQGGNIQIFTGSLSITQGAGISASTFGQGDAGSLAINAHNHINIDGTSADGIFRSNISSEVDTEAIGSGGNVQITAGSLSIAHDGGISVGTFGQGNAGNVIINVRDHINIDGSTADSPLNRAISSEVNSGAIGQGGDIQITTGSLSIAQNAPISTATFGQGNAGNVIIDARNHISLDGVSASGKFIIAISSQVLPEAVGQGGNIHITASSLSITQGAGIIANTSGQSNAGDIVINMQDHVYIDGTSIDGQSRSIIDGGDIVINANSLTVGSGALISANTFGQRDAGNIVINARDHITLDGTSTDGRFFSAIGSEVNPEAIGQGGDVQITTDSLSITQGALISASTLGQGNAGDVVINARNRIAIDGISTNGQFISAISSQVALGAIGSGGDVRLDTSSLSVTQGASLSVSTFGRGDAGDMVINVRDRIAIDGTSANGQSRSLISSQVNPEAIGRGGNVQINTGSLSITQGGEISASTLGQGNAGDVVINARDRIALDGTNASGQSASTIQSQVALGAIGNGGNVQVDTGSLSITQGAGILASTRGQGNAGDVIINARDRITLDGTSANGQVASAILSEVALGAVGNGGNVQVDTGSLAITQGAGISASTFGRGDAGDLIINARDRISLNGTRASGQFSIGIASAVASGAVGNGGTIRINTPELQLDNRAVIGANSLGRGRGGDIRINTASIEMDNGSAIITSTLSTNGGNIILRNLDYLLLRNRSGISTDAGTDRAGGNGGNITIGADFIVAVPSENSDITANAFSGRGGNVDISTEGLFGIAVRPQLTPLSDITASSERGVQGVVTITPPTVDPSRGLAELPVDLTDASQLISQNCPSGGNSGELGEFIVTGRGGLPPNPTQLLGNETVLTQLASAGTETLTAHSNPSLAHESASTTPPPLIEAQGWVMNHRGEVVLVAAVPTAQSRLATPTCGSMTQP